VLAGLLVGAACSVKPTGLLFVGVPVGVLLIGGRPAGLAKAIASGCAAGLFMLAPWLIRNYLASGNPVFPFAAPVLGVGSWTMEQAARYSGAHQFQGTVIERLRLLVGAQRGMLHWQWGVLFPVTLVAAAWLLWSARRSPASGKDQGGRRVLLVGIGLLAQTLLWLFTTHLQSRFLMPLIVPACVLCGVAASRLPQRCAWTAVLMFGPVCQLISTANVFIHQRGEKPGELGKPNALLIAGPALRTGQLVREMPRDMAAEYLRDAPPELFINLVLPPTAKVCLLGDATPLYLTRPVIYNTTYDTWPVSGEVSGWSAQLRERGVEFVLVNLSEIRRLERSGWTPPGITLSNVEEWMYKHTTPLKGWESMGVFLVKPVEPVRRGERPMAENCVGVS
jgi:hypothetical protein